MIFVIRLTKANIGCASPVTITSRSAPRTRLRVSDRSRPSSCSVAPSYPLRRGCAMPSWYHQGGRSTDGTEEVPMFDIRRCEFITLIGSAAAAWPPTARAQQPAIPVVGFLRNTIAAPFAHLVAELGKGLSEEGFEPRKRLPKSRSLFRGTQPSTTWATRDHLILRARPC
jgi:hypothetical protein